MRLNCCLQKMGHSCFTKCYEEYYKDDYKICEFKAVHKLYWSTWTDLLRTAYGIIQYTIIFSFLCHNYTSTSLAAPPLDIVSFALVVTGLVPWNSLNSYKVKRVGMRERDKWNQTKHTLPYMQLQEQWEWHRVSGCIIQSKN